MTGFIDVLRAMEGDELTSLMVRFNVGVRVARLVEIKRVHLDYFELVDPD